MGLGQVLCMDFVKYIDTGEGLTKSEPKQLLCLATKKSYFIFNGLLYKQTDGVAMGSPLGPSLSNAFLSYHEKNWLNSCPQGFKPVFYRLQILKQIFLSWYWSYL